jgi:hypothetical protein
VNPYPSTFFDLWETTLEKYGAKSCSWENRLQAARDSTAVAVKIIPEEYHKKAETEKTAY